MHSRRGQAAWGTMEILIAVIIMGFSMAIVYYAMQGVEEARCTAMLKSQTTSLQNALLDVALGAPSTQRRVDYNFISCGNKRVSAIRFVYFNDKKYCSRCAAATNGCWMLLPTYKDFKTNKLYDVSDADVCVDMPADINLEVKSTTDPSAALQCLGGSNRVTETPGCAAGSVCANGAGSDRLSSYNNVPSSIADSSYWRTFAIANGDPSVFRFIITKRTTQSQTGGSIEICPVKVSS